MAIAKLPAHLVNKIAAGEVIERPASVVKELVENALDSGASRVDVSIEDGGKRLIQVADDGCGMGRADAALAFSPHATSKLSGEDDLFNISTMGFRGEALASIASISHAHIRTRQAGQQEGWEVSASGESLSEPVPCAASTGTTVTIRDLFFNTPARRKFLKTTNTESGHITEQLTRLALPKPGVAFSLRHNGRETLNLPATDSTVARAASLFTPDLADCLLPIASRGGEVAVAGLAAPPAAARSAAKWQYVFVNGRYIRDRLISHAVREAYRGLLAPTKYPVVFLFIEIDPAEVDINVHPTKIEVRFRQGNLVHGQVLAALRETLNQADLRGQVTAELDDAPVDSARAANETKKESLRQALADFLKKAPAPQPRLDFPPGQPTGSPQVPQLSPPSPNFPQPSAQPGDTCTDQPRREDFAPEQTPVSPEPTNEPREQTPAPATASGQYELASPPAGPARSMLQVHDSYIVAQASDGLIIVDQHALHERVLYNDFKRRLLDGAMQTQPLLIPLSITVTPAEAEMLGEATELLGRIGIEVSPFGPDTFAVQRYPAVLARRGVAMDAFLRELLDKMAEDETVDPERLLEDVLAMMACKAAIKAGDPLGQAEMQALLDSADGLEKCSACPHGRPTTLRLTLKDLEKQFHRV
ncbi:MAG: DNA mismatch repair endonuclease MutL [Planctomycetota bacterium]|nr:MAG: DNA mismatch repair endonuclease MutL [Planctomycetota bacterium]